MIKQFFTCHEKLVFFKPPGKSDHDISCLFTYFSSLTSFVFVEFWYWFPNSWSQFPNDPVLNWVVYLGAVWSTSHEGRWGHHFGSWKENKKVLQVDDDGLAKFQPTHCYQDLFCLNRLHIGIWAIFRNRNVTIILCCWEVIFANLFWIQ